MQNNHSLPEKEPPKRYFLLVLLLGSLYLVYRILLPYLNTIIVSAALALVFHPVHRRILSFTRDRKTLASLCSCAIIICLVIIPSFFLISSLIAQGVSSFNGIYRWVNEGGLAQILQSEYVAGARSYLLQKISFVDMSKIDIQASLLSFSRNLGQVLLTQGTALVSNVVRLVIHFFLMVFILFYFLKDGAVMVERLRSLLPLTQPQTQRLLHRVQDFTRLTLVGTMLTALAQGVAGGIGLAIAGMPALFWGTVMAFTSLIPVVGTALIWVPATIYLIFNAKWGMVIFFVLWNVLVVGSVDNFLRPYLIGGEGGLSPLVIFLAILGGIQLFGVIGILYGPVIFGLCGALLYLYQLKQEDHAHEPERA